MYINKSMYWQMFVGSASVFALIWVKTGLKPEVDKIFQKYLCFFFFEKGNLKNFYFEMETSGFEMKILFSKWKSAQ